MSVLKRPRYGSQGMTGSTKKPNIWPLPLNIEWLEEKQWAKPIILPVDPINFSDYLDSKNDVMQMMNATYQMGGRLWRSAPAEPTGPTDLDWDTTMVFLTTSIFDVQSDDTVSPVRLAGDNDAIFRASTVYGRGDSVDFNDMKPYIAGKQVIDVVVPTIYVYAWRGNQSLVSGVVTGAAAGKHICLILVNYKMIKLAPEAKLSDYIAQNENSSFLELIPGP